MAAAAARKGGAGQGRRPHEPKLIGLRRAFVASLGTSGNSGVIIQSIVTLGHALGMKVLGEGVETDEQRVLLRLAGCDELQGHLFAMPAPAAEIDRAWAGLARRSCRRSRPHADRRFSTRYLSRVSRRFWAREGARDDPEQPPRP